MAAAAAASVGRVIAKQALSSGKAQSGSLQFMAIAIQYVHIKKPRNWCVILHHNRSAFQLFRGGVHHIESLAAGRFGVRFGMQNPQIR